MNDFETVLCCLVVICFAVMFYLAGRGNLFGLAPKLLLDRLEELNRKHGEWVEEYPGSDNIVCPACGKLWNVLDNCTEEFNYCPNCGAKMDLKEGAEE